MPPEPWDGVRDAVEYGATAQRGDPGITLIPEPSIPGESTLNVNVFTPAPGESDAALPVLVYIHGGGYIAGSPASPWYDGRGVQPRRRRDRHDLVPARLRRVRPHRRRAVATAACATGSPRSSGCATTSPRSAATPSRVTIAGQSAGGGAVLTLLGMPAAQHLFHAVWALSGALADVSAERARTLSAQAREPRGRRADARRIRLGARGAAARAAGEGRVAGRGDPLAGVRALLDDGLPWGPTIDGDLHPQPTLESLRAGVGADKPLVLGATDDEFTMITDGAKGKLRFIPVSLALGRLEARPRRRARRTSRRTAAQRRKGTAAVLGRFVTDRMFRTDGRADRRHPVARARRRRPGSTGSRGASPTMGWAVHCLDVPFWFDCLDADGVDRDRRRRRRPRALAAARARRRPSRSSATATRAGPPWSPAARHDRACSAATRIRRPTSSRGRLRERSRAAELLSAIGAVERSASAPMTSRSNSSTPERS